METPKFNRRDFLRSTAGGAAALALGLDSRPANAQKIEVAETYPVGEDAEALTKGRQMYSTLLANNPGIKEVIGSSHDISIGFISGGPRHAVRVMMTYIIHDKKVNATGITFGTIGGPRLLTPGELDKQYPGILAVIPAEKNMSYARFRDFFNTFVVKLRAEK